VIEFRWADNNYDRLPALAADLVRHHVAMIIAAGGAQSALAAKAASATIPILFLNGSDPVKLGLVKSLNRPQSNATGVTIITVQISQKRLELASQLVPTAKAIAFLINPLNPNAGPLTKELMDAARNLGRKLLILNVTNERDVESVFATLMREQAGVVVTAADPIFTTLRQKLIELPARFSIPTIYPYREHVFAGGLMSYGPRITDGFRQVGIYAARILNGEKPSDLPVIQPTRFEFIINLKTAKAIGLTIPPTLLALADEVVE
jgi:putative ABC transport system substrate-binding protein